MEIEEFVYMMLETEDFEDFLERFDLAPAQVFKILIENGHVDMELVKEMMGDGSI